MRALKVLRIIFIKYGVFIHTLDGALVPCMTSASALGSIEVNLFIQGS